MVSSFDWDLEFDPFNYVTVLLDVVVLFVLCILTAYCCNFDFNFYYPRINKDKITTLAETLFILFTLTSLFAGD